MDVTLAYATQSVLCVATGGAEGRTLVVYGILVLETTLSNLSGT